MRHLLSSNGPVNGWRTQSAVLELGKATGQMAEITPSPFQEHAMVVPESYDLFLGGGRGFGKSYCLA